MITAGLLLLTTMHSAPYSLPWQLRGASAATVLRSDTAFAFHHAPNTGRGSTIATMLFASYQVTPDLAPFVRMALVNHMVAPGGDRSALANPVLGATYSLKPTDDLRLAFSLAFALPVGTTSDVTRAGVLARSAMDNAMFAVNDFVVFPGIDFAWVAHNLTIQLEVTLLELVRVRNEDTQPDAAKTNFTAGIHIGYFVAPSVSFGAELRYQRWLSTPAAVEKDPSQREALTVAVGPRFHVQLDDTTWIRPGLAYSRGLDDPMTRQNYQIFQLDLPIAF